MIDELRAKIAAGKFEFSRHALDQSLLRDIGVQDVREVFRNGEVIEEYPNDKYGPSCLVLGFTTRFRPLHIQCSASTRPIVKIITLYEPDAALWIDFRQRKDKT